MLCYSKPKLLMVDDDDLFLSITKKYLEMNLGKQTAITTFKNDSEILEYINCNDSDYCSPLDIYKDYIKQHLSLNCALNELEKHRPILIIDQNLCSKLTGTEICKIARASNPNINVLLLTGEIDYKKATDLHNDHIIDYFFRKDETDLIKKITKAVSTIIVGRKEDFAFDGELGANEGVDMIFEADYRSNLSCLLDNINYSSYMITNQNGDIAVKDPHEKTYLYKQSDNRGIFKANGTSNI
ncbi:MAG: hypothetical protein KBD25_00435 [Rickettsiaceae bacterium]|nr:hypothetical protein [Rickettsiaceae bacterium]